MAVYHRQCRINLCNGGGVLQLFWLGSLAGPTTPDLKGVIIQAGTTDLVFDVYGFGIDSETVVEIVRTPSSGADDPVVTTGAITPQTDSVSGNILLALTAQAAPTGLGSWLLKVTAGSGAIGYLSIRVVPPF